MTFKSKHARINPDRKIFKFLNFTSMIIDIIQIVAAIALIIAILLQNRGAGLGAAFGGEGNVYRTRRSFEKILFRATIALAAIFFITAFINILY